jgi:RimJ/RimL family protein N-acetyltransferase
MALEGTLVVLREQRAEDQRFLVDLRNDLDTQAWSKALPPDYTEEMYQKRLREREFSYDRDEGRFTIVHKASGQLVGYIGYTDLEPRFSATIGIVVAKEFWGTGVALDAQETLLRFLFVELGVRVVRLWTHSGNPHAVQLAERSGFQISGRVREAVFIGGELHDNLIVDLLREEYFDQHPELEDHLPSP